MNSGAGSESVQFFSVGEIEPSLDNPRKTMEEGPLAQLTESVKQLGVQVPLLVRPGAGCFMIIAGHRRYAAAQRAGLKELPCIVRDVSADEAREIMLVENLQREDLRPLEEAEAYQEMFRAAGEASKPLTPADLAARIGKSESYVRLRLRLISADKGVQDALRSERITLAHALELARLERDTQKALLDWLEYDIGWDGRRGAKRQEAPSVAELRNRIAREILLDLSKAPFDTKSPKLVPAAGACVDCKKRTGNNQVLFADVKKGDTCTDPRCFDAKVSAHIDVTVEKLTAQGKTALRISSRYERRKETPANALTSAAYEALESHGKNAKQDCDATAIGVYVDGDKRGRTQRICTDKKCNIHSYSYVGSVQKPSDAAAKERAAIRIEQTARIEIFKGILAASEKVEMEDRDYLDIAEYAINRADSNGSRRMVTLLGWPKDTLGYGNKKLRQKLEEVGIERAIALARAAIVSTELGVTHTWAKSGAPRLDALAKDYGVDAKKIRDQVKTEAAAKTKKKPAATVKKAAGQPAPKAGTCRYCGCTEDMACEGGCSWIDAQQTVCSNPRCVEQYEAAGRALPKIPAKKGQKSTPKKLSPAAKKRIAEAMKKRWAKTQKTAKAVHP